MIPNSVTSIGDQVFENCTSLASITIPSSVTSIGDFAFFSCFRLTGVYFQGNAPSYGLDDFGSDGIAIAYYLPGATGWSTSFGGAPAALWLPQVQTDGNVFGVQSNQFGFNINWASGETVVVEACTDLSNPIWTPVSTNVLTSGSSYFGDSQWMNFPSRFYRLRSP